jgi:hypothetical protein
MLERFKQLLVEMKNALAEDIKYHRVENRDIRYSKL